MSGWDAWINPLVDSKAAKSVGIYGHDGNPWAQSKGFSVSAAEVKAIVVGAGKADAFAASGVMCAGTKYMFLRAQDNYVFGKKGAGGCGAYKTSKAVIIGVYDENTQAGTFNTAIGKTADALAAAGY